MTNSGHERPGELRDLLPRPDVPPELRERVISTYQSRNAHLRHRQTQRWMTLAAAIVFFLVGFTAGRSRLPPSQPDASQLKFALLLYSGDSGAVARADVAEHVRWASDQRKAGRLVSGEKLEDESLSLTPAGTPASEPPLRGFFIISAGSIEEAAAVARQLPHFRHGGRVVVRPIGRT